MANNKIYDNYLMHYRTKGSRNGYSKDPNYTPIGQKAEGTFDAQRQHARNIAASRMHLAARSAGGYGAARASVGSGVARPKVSKEYQEEVADNSRKNYNTSPDTRHVSMESVRNFSRASQGLKSSMDNTAGTANNIRRQQKMEADRRRIKTDVGRAIYDARHDKDFGSFMRKDIADRGKSLIKKGKKKVSKLLNKLKPQTKTSISSKTDLLEGHIDNRPREKQIRRKK